MNKIETKETREQWLERAKLRLLDRDVIPSQVAIEMLCRPLVHMSSRERRVFRNALETHFVSTLEQKPREEKLTFKLKNSSWAQLNKWLKRTNTRYFNMQKRYSVRAEKVAGFKDGTPEKILGERALAAFGMVMGSVGEALELLETEVETRSALALAANRIPTEEVAV